MGDFGAGGGILSSSVVGLRKLRLGLVRRAYRYGGRWRFRLLDGVKVGGEEDFSNFRVFLEAKGRE